MLRARDWGALYRSKSSRPITGGWSEHSFIAFAKKYVEPKGGRVVVQTHKGGINGLKFYQILMESLDRSGPPPFSEFYMPTPKPGTYKSIGTRELASSWDYEFTLGDSVTLSHAAHAWFPNAPKTRNSIDDPALYEFLLKEGATLRKMGCQHLWAGSTKDDLAFQVDSIEEHARLYKTARNLVPIAAKYGRTMKYPPTASELAMK